jgi:hypothetical protein
MRFLRGEAVVVAGSQPDANAEFVGIQLPESPVLAERIPSNSPVSAVAVVIVAELRPVFRRPTRRDSPAARRWGKATRQGPFGARLWRRRVPHVYSTNLHYWLDRWVLCCNVYLLSRSCCNVATVTPYFAVRVRIRSM